MEPGTEIHEQKLKVPMIELRLLIVPIDSASSRVINAWNLLNTPPRV